MELRNQSRLILRPAWLAGFVCLLLAGCVSAGGGGSLDATMPSFSSPTPQAAGPSPVSTTPPAPDIPSPQPTGTPTAEPTPTTPAPVNAAALPDPAGYDWQPVAAGLDLPIGLAHVKDGSNRVFILEQEGRIRILVEDELIAEPFLDITDRVGANGSERGLLGLAFHPDYTQNGFFYVHYTDDNGDTVIARFTVSADPNLADPATEMRLMSQ